ncbi:MAG: DNA polymerase III subunit delta [Alphaproteobacteria bacterium PRO2]|nr:DNA polymerase III subunit delta [Alphaproteobacteria bacterium PRO2]
MKLNFRNIESFLKKPDPAARVILVYGPDNGLMRERAKALALTVVKDFSDPFNVAVLSTDILIDDPARLADEAGAISMMGGDRVIRVEEAADKLTPLIKSYLANPSPSSLVILEAGELTTKSSLRRLCETAANAAAMPCYVEEERDLARLIRETMQSHNLQIDNDAVAWLAAGISGDRLKARGELEKLATYKGEENSPVSLADAQAACGESGARSLDDLIFSVGNRQSEKSLQVYTQLQEEGVPFIVVLRALQNHFRRLHLVKAGMDGGDNPQSAMTGLSPPVFFKYENAFRDQVNTWSLNALGRVMTRLADVEASCKKTGAPVETLCAQAVLGISAMRG